MREYLLCWEVSCLLSPIESERRIAETSGHADRVLSVSVLQCGQ